MGLTAGCADCHDHKFDPLSQREFYELAAFFNNTTQNPMDGNIKDTPPVVVVPQAEDRPRWEALSKELTDLRKQADARKQAARADFDQWLTDARPARIAAAIPHQGLKFHALLSEGAGNAITVANDGQLRQVVLDKPLTWQAGQVAAQAYRSEPGTVIEVEEAGDFDKDQAFSYGAWVRLPKNGLVGALFARMDNGQGHRGWDLWFENGRAAAHLIHKWPDDAIKVAMQNRLKPAQWHHVFVTYDGSGKAAGVRIYLDGEVQGTTVQADTLKNTIRTEVPLKLAQRHTESRIDGLLLQDVRLYGRTLPAHEVEQVKRGTRAAWLAGKPADKRSDAEKNELFAWWLPAQDEPYRALAAKITPREAEESVIKSRGTIAHVMQERGEGAMAYILFRGEYDQRRDSVQPKTPTVLPSWPDELPKNRLGLAQWLLRPEHPLTARVTVNRFWQEVFGTGLVRTSGDFGVSGELPSHPELLDWLAVEFRDGDWDIKRFFKLLVTSATYRQSALTTAAKRQKDPENRLLSRGPRFRMDGEMIRDYALAASGLLVRKLGGPSVKPYQPEGVWEAVAMIGSNTRDYRRDTGPSLYRRSLYTFWKRSAPPAQMDIFNAPSRETCSVRRERTNTPLQALVTLNDVQFVEAARHLAERAMRDQGSGIRDQESGIDFLARRLLCRPLRAEEVKVVRESLDELLDHYKAHPDDARKLIAVGESKADPELDSAKLAAWTMLANELMNLDEVLNK
jgi:hypothetical protein